MWETRQREVQYQVAVKVPYTKTIQVKSGNWTTQTYEVQRPVCKKTVASVGTFEWDRLPAASASTSPVRA